MIAIIGVIASARVLAASNLILSPDAFDSADWNKNGVTVSQNVGNNSDGLGTADIIIPSISLSSHIIFQGFAVGNGTPYTASCEFKPNGYKNVTFQIWNSGFGVLASITIDANAGVIVGTPTNPSGGALGTITSTGSGWYQGTLYPISNSTTSYFVIFILDDSGADNYIGDGTSGVLAAKAKCY